MATMTLNKRLDLIQDKILEKNFITGRGTANEVNFLIFDYDAEDEMAVRSHVGHLVDKINKRNDNVRIAHFDLYDLMLDVLRSKNPCYCHINYFRCRKICHAKHRHFPQ